MTGTACAAGAHAIGDAANKVVLEAYKKALVFSDDPRWRVDRGYDWYDWTDFRTGNVVKHTHPEIIAAVPTPLFAECLEHALACVTAVAHRA